MAEYLSPGVYIEEVDRGTKPIESVGTSTLGVLGVAGKGPRNEATLITNWSQYTRVFGEFGDSWFIGTDGGPGTRTGLKTLEEVDEVAVVAVPGQTSPAVQEEVLSHCERLKDRFA